jgi:hypothetical protein
VITKLQIVALGTVGVLAVASPLSAHHSWPVDCSSAMTVTGTVIGYTWANPHVMIGLEVKGDNGMVENWTVGGPSLRRMAENTWDRDSLKPGDVITGTGSRFLDGSNVLKLSKIVMSDGTEMFLYDNC